MTTATNQAPAQTQQQEALRFADVKNAGLQFTVSLLNAGVNTARTAEHVTGILADKAENYRKQIAISDAVEHNALMIEYTKQAKEAGIDLDQFAV